LLCHCKNGYCEEKQYHQCNFVFHVVFVLQVKNL
jgi:hypothetical protein